MCSEFGILANVNDFQTLPVCYPSAPESCIFPPIWKLDAMMKKTTFFFLIIFFAAGCETDVKQAPTSAAPASIAPQKLWTEADRQFLLSELDRTTEELRELTDRLGRDQWAFKENEFRWSIGEILEHLTVQNELDYREITVIANGPEMPEYLAVTQGQDAYFQAYATSPEKSQAKWFLQPLGRFAHWRQHQNGFLRARDGLRDFIEATEVDLRKHFTFRNNAGAKKTTDIKIGDVRDLHQLVLTGIAHTDRHIRQIREIKKNRQYPRDI